MHLAETDLTLTNYAKFCQSHVTVDMW